MLDYASLCSDKYQYTTGLVMFKKGNDKKQAVFDMFYRKAPDGNNWAIVAGIKQVVNMIKMMNSNSLSKSEKIGFFYNLFKNEEYVNCLSQLKFTGKIYAMKDGEIAFPNEPIISIHAPLLEAQVLETPILCIMNHAMAIATKASRIYRASQGRPVISMGTRRSHGIWAGVYGDEYATIGGCSGISNILTDYLCGIPCTGTMSHSYIESYGVGKENEYRAFYDFVDVNPVNSNILLVDTYDVIRSGLPNAIKVFQEFGLDEKFEKTGECESYGIRLDSGDLAYLSKYCRKELDKAGLCHAKIIATNGLDEYKITDLLNQGAEIDIFGVGDAIATSKHNPCFGGVYKLAEIDGEPTIKLSEDTIKIINPCAKSVLRLSRNLEYLADVICLKYNDGIATKLLKNQFIIKDEFDPMKFTIIEPPYTFKNLLFKVDINRSAYDLKEYCNYARNYFLKNLNSFSPECTRLSKPHIYKVDISDDLYKIKYNLINKIRNELQGG